MNVVVDVEEPEKTEEVVTHLVATEKEPAFAGVLVKLRKLDIISFVFSLLIVLGLFRRFVFGLNLWFVIFRLIIGVSVTFLILFEEKGKSVCSGFVKYRACIHEVGLY